MTIKFHAAVGVAIVLGIVASASASDTAMRRGAAIASAFDCTGCGTGAALLQPARFTPGVTGAPAGYDGAEIRQLAVQAKDEDAFVAILSAIGARPPKPFRPGLQILSESDIRALYRYLQTLPAGEIKS